MNKQTQLFILKGVYKYIQFVIKNINMFAFINVAITLIITYVIVKSSSDSIYFNPRVIAYLSLLLVASLVSLSRGRDCLWIIAKNILKTYPGFNHEYIDKDGFVEDWISENFEYILKEKTVVNLISQNYYVEFLRRDHVAFLNVISNEYLTASNRAKILNSYYLVFTANSLFMEPHRIKIFTDILDMNLDFEFEEGCEQYFRIFNCIEIKEKMAKLGWTHPLMIDLLGKSFYEYPVPGPFYFIDKGESFNSWFKRKLGNKPKLKSIIQNKIIDKENKVVKWEYFNYFVAYDIFEFNYDIFLKEIETSLDNKLKNPFWVVDKIRINNKEKYKKSIVFLKKYFGDSKLIKLLKTLNSSIELEESLIHIENCMDFNYKLIIPKNVRTWKELSGFARSEFRKASQNNFSLEQHAIYDWEGMNILKYTIWVPKTNYRLISGGREMHNCIGNGEYAQRIIDKHRYVFFLKKGTKTQVCIELNYDDFAIVCIKGLANAESPAGVYDAVQEFVENKINKK